MRFVSNKAGLCHCDIVTNDEYKLRIYQDYPSRGFSTWILGLLFDVTLLQSLDNSAASVQYILCSTIIFTAVKGFPPPGFHARGQAGPRACMRRINNTSVWTRGFCWALSLLEGR